MTSTLAITAKSPSTSRLSARLPRRRMRSLIEPDKVPTYLSKEVNYCSSPCPIEWVALEDANILMVESTIEAEVLLTTEESIIQLLNFDASYHLTLFWSQF